MYVQCSSYLDGVFFHLFSIGNKMFHRSPMNMVGYFLHSQKKLKNAHQVFGSSAVLCNWCFFHVLTLKLGLLML